MWGTWHDLLGDSRAAQHVAFLQHGCAQPCPLQVGSLWGACVTLRVARIPFLHMVTPCPHQGSPCFPNLCRTPSPSASCRPSSQCRPRG